MKQPILSVLAMAILAGLPHTSPVYSQDAPAAESSTAAPEEISPEAQEFANLVQSIDWKTEGTGELGKFATLNVPTGYRFTAKGGTVKMMEAFGNLVSSQELGFISPLGLDWFAVFEFDNCGYVKDDEKDKLDADKILNQMKEDQIAANKELTKRGLDTLEVVGWKIPPFYNPQTNNLEWAIRLKTNSGETVNYRTKILGRTGVMDVVLVCDGSELDTVIPQYQELLKGYAYKSGQSYQEYRSGDKIAEYGLTGLILGGGLLAAAKTGLLTKLWKPILVGLVAVGAFFKKIFGGSKSA